MSIMTQRIQWTKPAVLMCLLVGLTACGGETRVTRIDAGVVTDLSGRWNDTDSRIVAESMVKEALDAFPQLTADALKGSPIEADYITVVLGDTVRGHYSSRCSTAPRA